MKISKTKILIANNQTTTYPTSYTMSAATDLTYNNVTHRKGTGSLILIEQGLFFQPNNTTSSNGWDGKSDQNVISWQQVTKHQVSPASHPKALLKLVVVPSKNNNITSLTFCFSTRTELESARREITARLSNSKKRARDNTSNDEDRLIKKPSTPPSSSYVTPDPIALIATRSSLLSSDPALRSQHRLLVIDTNTLSEDDFWDTHFRLVADEYAKISGKANRGMSSDIKSSLDLGASSFSGAKSSSGKKEDKKDSKDGSSSGKSSRGAARGVVHLGVEEIRQIFLMYPAVHKAYEEKVPLELSEEQFWRKYLESEYFHRDRGRIGSHVNRVNEREMMERERFGRGGVGGNDEKKDMSSTGKGGDDGDDKNKGKKDDKKKEGEERMGEDEAKSRLAAAGTDDIFSRYDRGSLMNGVGGSMDPSSSSSHQLGTNIAVGQFDLASTAEKERGSRFLEGLDFHPPPESDSRGARVIDKYNRHWAIVLHPNESKANVDLSLVARKSVTEGVVPNNSNNRKNSNKDATQDAKVNGGNDREMRRLVGFANATENSADHSRGIGDDDGEDEIYTELTLRNVGAYSGKFSSDGKGSGIDGVAKSTDSLRFTKYLAAAMRTSTEPLLRDETTGKTKGFCNAPCLKQSLPDPKIGRGLLEALTKKMAADSQTEADVQLMADTLDEEFRTKLSSFFRRAAELLRHFFSLRSVFNDDSNGGTARLSESEKKRMANIVKGMEKVYGEMHKMKLNLQGIESAMCNPIMDQLDWAFKLHREDISAGGGGGFVTVAKGGFVPVEQF